MIKKNLKSFIKGRGYTQDDWNDVSDSPELTADTLSQARAFSEVFPEMIEATDIKPAKKRVTILLDQDVIAAFQASGAGWQSRIADIVKNAKPM